MRCSAVVDTVKLVAAVVVFGSLLGCEGIKAPEKRIAERAEGRWQALIEGDLRGAYEYLTPGYRETTSFDRYRGRFGGAVAWKKASVSDVELDEEARLAQVTLRLEYQAADATGTVVDMARGVRETWLNSNGKWYFSPN